METWFAQTPAVLAALGILSGLGILLVAPLRMGRLATLALAPLASVAVLSVLAVFLGWMHVPWTALPIVIGCLFLVGVMWGVGAFIGRAERTTARDAGGWVLAAGLIVGAVVGVLRIGFYIGDAVAISQTNDAVFHLNALRYALESGSVSSFDISAVIGATSFYPAAWHAVVLAVAQLSGATLPAAINAVSLAIAAAVWVPGIAWFTREAVVRAAPARATIAAAFAAALAASLLAFPLLMLQWGVLYPNALSVALVPAASALVLIGLRWVDAGAPARRSARIAVLVVLLAAAAAAIGLAQPASLLAWLVFVVSFLTWVVIGRSRGSDRSRWWTALQLLGVWASGAVLWLLVARTSPGALWTTFESELAALLDILSNGLVDLPAQIIMSILMVVGLIVAVRVHELRWIAMSWLGFAALYFVAAAIDRGGIRHYVVGPWYADPYRLAALLPLAVIPLAAIALAWFLSAGTARLPRLPQDGTRLPLVIIAVIALVQAALLAAVPVIQLPLVTEGIADSQSRYAIDAQTYLSTDERALLERLPEVLPEDARIVGNPSTGMGFAFALSGVDAFPRTWSPPSGDEWALLAEHLRDASDMPAVCDALDTFGNPEYVLDFGPGETTAGRFKMPGFTEFAGQPGFSLVDSEGDASLWRIDAC